MTGETSSSSAANISEREANPYDALAEYDQIIEDFRHLQRAVAGGKGELSHSATYAPIVMQRQGGWLEARIYGFPESKKYENPRAMAARNPDDANFFEVHFAYTYAHDCDLPTLHFGLTESQKTIFAQHNGAMPVGIEASLPVPTIIGTIEELKTMAMDSDLNPDIAPQVRSYYAWLANKQEIASQIADSPDLAAAYTSATQD